MRDLRDRAYSERVWAATVVYRPFTKREHIMGKFKKGNPGGPGRPVGYRTATNRVLDALASEGAEQVLKKQIELAQEGDGRAADLILKRVWLQPRGRPVDIDLPPIEKAADLLTAHAAVMSALRTQTISPEEAMTIASALDSQRRAIELVEITQRIRALEAKFEESEPA
jgi:hypothetical protein